MGVLRKVACILLAVSSLASCRTATRTISEERHADVSRRLVTDTVTVYDSTRVSVYQQDTLRIVLRDRHVFTTERSADRGRDTVVVERTVKEKAAEAPRSDGSFLRFLLAVTVFSVTAVITVICIMKRATSH